MFNNKNKRKGSGIFTNVALLKQYGVWLAQLMQRKFAPIFETAE